MKLKFVLVPLVVLGFAVGSYADCSKDEILKLIDKGFTKTDINGICGKSEKKTALKWITPNKKTCVSYGGKIKEGVCSTDWSAAQDICRNLGGKLPSFDELKQVVVDCGGTIDDYDNNRANSMYQDCYKKRGFISSYYWSSTIDVSNKGNILGIGFNFGDTLNGFKTLNHHVSCVMVVEK